MSKFRALVKNIGIFTISTVAIKLVVFLLVPLYTYYLTPVEFGLTDMLNATVWLVFPIATLSIADAVLRFVIEDKEKSENYISTGFYTMMLSCIIIVAILPLLNFPVFGGLGHYGIWFVLCYSTIAFQTFFSSVARGLNQFKLIAIVSVISSVINIVLAILLIAVIPLGIHGFFSSIFFANLTGAILYLLFGHHQRFIRFKWVKGGNTLRKMLLYSIPLIPNSLFWWATQSINRFFITAMIGIGASGIFAAASKIPSVVNLLSNIFIQAWNISAFQESDSSSKQKFYSSVFIFFNSIMLIGSGALSIGAEWIARILFQREFYQAWIFVPVLVLSSYYAALSAFYGSIYAASMKTKQLFISSLLGTVVCIVLTYAFVLKFGIIGAGIATVISNLIIWIHRAIDSRRLIHLKISVTQLTLENVLLIAIVWASSVQGGQKFFLAALFFFALLLIEIYISIKTYKNYKRISS